jgi:lon-related putative ATP-dependent protease
MNICRFVCSTVKENGLLHFDRGALKETVKKAIFIAGDRRKISTKFGKLKQLIIESSAEANEDSSLVKAIHVKKAWNGIKMRASLYKEKMENAIYDNTIYIDTEGEKIGEINGLTVLENEDIAFGNPVKIIAKVSSGSKGFIDIQKETGLGGKIHHKASMTIQGYLNSNFGRDFPIDINAFISFEQVYGKIEGDSASVAELVALLSSISEIPLKQSIAVTGSINQSGLVQPVGGIPFKIEGFYNICKKRGLDGSHGVIIPFSNINNLVLPDEIIKDISKSRFRIWTIESVDEAIEILTGKKAGKRIDSGKFEKNSFNERVKSKLENFYNILKKSDKGKH